MDQIDKKLLNLLQQDAKMTHKELSLKLNLSTTAIYERIKKMEKAGIIEKYSAILNRKSLGRELMVYCHIKLEKHSQENIALFEKQISKLPEVHECFHVSGDYDYILKMTFSDMDVYRDFMVNKLTTISCIGSSHSIFVINEVKSEVGYSL
jgi:Lrp/AsnC family leucine-responsive transcriptional regulator